MSKKKSTTYDDELNLEPWSGPPYSYDVWIDGEKIRMSGFSVQHIYDQLEKKKPTKIVKLKDDN